MRVRSIRSWFVTCGAVLAVGVTWARPVETVPPLPTPPPVQVVAPPADPAPAAPVGPSPHIQFDKIEIDLGDVIHGQDAVATFTYQNTGPVPLHILSAKPG